MPDSKKAFTLVELLVVISIILIASSIIFIGGGGGDGAKLSSAQRIVSGIAQGARGQAILKNGETRLIIYNEVNDPEKYRRYFGIVYWGDDVDDNGNVIATGWKAATSKHFQAETHRTELQLRKVVIADVLISLAFLNRNFLSVMTIP